MQGSKPRLYVSVNVFVSMAAMLRDSVAADVVRTRPRAKLLAMMTMRKSTFEFPFLFHDGLGLRLAARRAAGAPLLVPIDQSSIKSVHEAYHNKVVFERLVKIKRLVSCKNINDKGQIRRVEQLLLFRVVHAFQLFGI